MHAADAWNVADRRFVERLVFLITWSLFVTVALDRPARPFAARLRATPATTEGTITVEFGIFIQNYVPNFRREKDPDAGHTVIMDELDIVIAADKAGSIRLAPRAPFPRRVLASLGQRRRCRISGARDKRFISDRASSIRYHRSIIPPRLPSASRCSITSRKGASSSAPAAVRAATRSSDSFPASNRHRAPARSGKT